MPQFHAFALIGYLCDRVAHSEHPSLPKRVPDLLPPTRASTGFAAVLVVAALTALVSARLRPFPRAAIGDPPEAPFERREAQYFPCASVLFPNSDFAGPGLAPWRASGTAFDGQHPGAAGSSARSRLVEPFGVWVGTFERGGDLAQGTLVSPDFTIEGDVIAFRVGGGANLVTTYVALFVEGVEVYRASGRNAEALRTTRWDVSSHRGKDAHIEVVDQSTGPYGHVQVERFCFAR